MLGTSSASRHTPAPVIAQLAAALDQTLDTPSIVESWKKAGMDTYPKAQRGPQPGDQMFRAEVKRWGQLITENKIKAAD